MLQFLIRAYDDCTYYSFKKKTGKDPTFSAFQNEITECKRTRDPSRITEEGNFKNYARLTL